MAFILGPVLATLSWGVAAAGLSSDFDGDGHADIVVGVPLDDVGGAKNAGTIQVFYGCDQSLPSRNQILGLDDPQIPDSAAPGDQFGSAVAWGDFNDDGFADLAVGAPFKAVGTKKEAGKVYVVYGGANGLSTAGSETWIQGGSSNIADRPDAGDWFGAALTAGDLNGDGFDDLIVGAPHENVENTTHAPVFGDQTRLPDAGAITVIFGGAGGLGSGRPNLYWNQDIGNGASWSEPNDCHGFSVLSGGDFDGDGFQDLATGAPCEHTGGGDLKGANYGATDASYGDPQSGIDNGPTRRPVELYIRQWADWLAGEPNADDAFGSALALGDFNGDGADDLAMGVPGEDYGSQHEAGAVEVLYGVTGVGLVRNVDSNELWHLDTIAGPGSDALGDLTGATLNAGDFNHDGFDDLAIGVPHRAVAGANGSGAVYILYGSAKRLTAAGHQVWTEEGLPGISVGSEDAFGYTLQSGDYDGDGVDDLAIGIPGRNVDGIINAGAIAVLCGSPDTGLADSGQTFLYRGMDLVAGTPADNDQFGGMLKPILRKGVHLIDVLVDREQLPHGGAAHPIPGRIEVEDYDEGGDFVAYQDTTSGNKGGAYRPDDDVDLWVVDDGGQQAIVLGATDATEWLEFTVDVRVAGTYSLGLRVATPKNGRRLHLKFGGQNKTGTITLPNTGAWDGWQTVSVPVALTAGMQVMRLEIDRGGFNLNWLDLEGPATGGGNVEIPSITPAGGPIAGPTPIALATTTPGATIFYTTDGSDPTDPANTTREQYGAPFILGGQPGTVTLQVRAYATAPGLVDSPVTSATFTVTSERVATPIIDPAGGTITDIAPIALSTTTPGAAIFYTTDGSDPSAPGNAARRQYSAPFTLGGQGGAVTVQAYATAPGFVDSPLASAPFTVTVTTTGQTPFSGAPIPIPGRVEMEDYDLGGEGLAYHDTTTGNKGGAHRSDDVDIWLPTSGEGTYVGANATGEWREYTVDVATAGQYDIDLRVATPKDGRRIHLESDGQNLNGTIAIPNTGGWQTWQTVTVSTTLPAGPQILRIVHDNAGMNFNWADIYPSSATESVATPSITPPGGTIGTADPVSLQTTTPDAQIYYTLNGTPPTPGSTLYTGEFTLQQPGPTTVKAVAVKPGLNDSQIATAIFMVSDTGQQPYLGVPVTLPGRVEVENYDLGGEGLAYHDTTRGNKGGQYRSDDVDIWRSGGSVGTYVGATASGEWLEYAVDVGAADTYTASIRVTTPKSGKRLHLEIDGVPVTGQIGVPNTGSWHAWQTISTPIPLPAGRHTLRLAIDKGGFNVNWLEFGAP